MMLVTLHVNNFVLQANSRIKEFKTKLLQFEDKLDTLLLGNSAIGAMSWIPTSKTSILVVSYSIRSFRHTVDKNEVEGDAGKPLKNEENAVVEEIKHLRKRKMAKAEENNPSRSKDGLKRELLNAVKVLSDMAVKIVDNNEAPKTVVSSSDKAIEDAIGILNNFDGVEVSSPFYYQCVMFY